jgi:lactam utilization protein B
MGKVTIYQIDAVGKLCRYQTRTLSYIKPKRVMHQELRHQVKIHKISEKLNTGINICIFPPPLLKKKNNKNMLTQRRRQFSPSM